MPVELTPKEIEDERINFINDYGEVGANPGPGSLYCHEALDRTGNLCASVDEQICGHPSVFSNPEWFAMAIRARMALSDLYQAIGAVHLDTRNPNE